MAAPSRTGPADARIPCPLCSGPIHPIAGRCKHCKGDLSALRGNRPAAAAALPPLVAQAASAAPAPIRAPQAPDPYAIAANGHGHHNGHVGAYQAPISPAQIAHAAAAYHQPGGGNDIAQPILPPRPTGRVQIPIAPRASWKSWPVIVIVLAVIAIVTAVVLMVWPSGGTAEAGPATTRPIPAPERMDTSPLPPSPPPPSTQPPSSQNDPWSGQTTPPGHQQAPDIDDPDLKDPIGGDPFSPRGGALTGATAVIGAATLRMCDRLSHCTNVSVDTRQMCQAYARFGRHISPPNCAAMQRCTAKIDNMDCDALTGHDFTAIAQLLIGLPDCTEAASC